MKPITVAMKREYYERVIEGMNASKSTICIYGNITRKPFN
jgi:hypothetical protein